MLDPSADEIREWGNSVIQLITDYLGDLRDRRVYRQTSSREIHDRLDATLPTKGIDFDGLLKVFCETIIPFSRQNAHPRMFGYVQSPGTPIGAFADLLASTLNANLTVWRSAPAPVELERLRPLAHLYVERNPFFCRQGSGSFGNRAGECMPRRHR